MSRSGSKKKVLRCPTCRQLVAAKDPEFPFCSEHCRTIDLGKWASGAYRISSPVFDPDILDPDILDSDILENLDERQNRSPERLPRRSPQRSPEDE